MIKEITTSKMVMPEHLNPAGNLFGGQMMAWMDKVTAMLALEFTGRNCVTVKADKIEFKEPVFLGDIVELKAATVQSGNTSLKISIIAKARKATGDRNDSRFVSSSIFTFVAMDDNKPTSNWRNR